MSPARAPRSVAEMRILVVDALSGTRAIRKATDFASLLEPGDLVVVNDAATLPASLHGTTTQGAPIELRLAGALDGEGTALRFRAALLGAGDHRTPTEDRPLPPDVGVGERLQLGAKLVARVLAVASFASRLLDLELELAGASPATEADLWAALYQAGKPVQYAHVPQPLALWDVQNVFASRPWAVEMPSAGRSLRVETLLALRRRGVAIATITHAAGLSATGDAAIDARLPLPERFEVPEATVQAILRARARGGRVIAIGTSVVRALESAARLAEQRGASSPVIAASGTTELLLRPGSRRGVVDALLTGVHESDTTHFTLLGAFADRNLLAAALATAEEGGLLGHELGDAWLVWGTPSASRCASWPSLARAASATVAA